MADLAEFIRSGSQDALQAPRLPDQRMAPPPTPGAALEAFLRQPEPDTNPTNDAALAVTVGNSGANPAAAAQANKVGRQLGLPQSAVETDLPRFQADATAKKNAAIVKGNWLLSQWVAANPDAARIARDDYEHLSAMQQLVKGWKSGFGTADIQATLVDIYSDELRGVPLTPARERQKADLQAQLKTLEQPEEGGLGYVSRVTGYSARQMGSSLYAGAAGVGYGGVAGAAAGSILPGVGTVAGGAAGMIAGAATAAGMYSYRQESAFAFDELRNMQDIDGKPLDVQVARSTAMAIGVVNSAIEVGSDAALMTLMPGAKALIGSATGQAAKRALMDKVKSALAVPSVRTAMAKGLGVMAGGSAIEGAEEFFQSLVGAIGREGAQAASGQEFAPDSLSADLTQAASEARDAAIGTFFTLAPFGAAKFGSMHIHARRQQQITKAQEDVQSLQKMFDAANQTTLVQSKEEFATALDHLSEGENVRFDAQNLSETLQQSGISVDEFVKAMPSAAEQMADAEASGGEISIPVGEFISGTRGTPMEELLKPHARLGDNDYSEVEAQQSAETAQQFLVEDSERVIQQAQDSASLRKEYEAVKSSMAEKLNTLGRFGKEANDVYAVTHASVLTSMADRLARYGGEQWKGITPQKLDKMFNLSVVSEAEQNVLSQPTAEEAAKAGAETQKQRAEMIDLRKRETTLDKLLGCINA